MTTTTPTNRDVDTSTIEHLDFDPTCTVRNPRVDITRCGAPADWWILCRRHCGTGTCEAMWCQGHHDAAMKAGVLTCVKCRVLVPLEDHVLRTERIR